jgi:YVTN family beta-propeller protein
LATIFRFNFTRTGFTLCVVAPHFFSKGLIMTRIRMWAVPTLVVLLIGGLSITAEPKDSGYKIIKKIELGGDGGWDYLTMDSDSGRLYISRGTRVQVVDVEMGKLVGEVADTKGVHGIALAPKHKKGFTSNGQDASVTVFDPATLKETGRIKVGMGPDGIIYDPATDQVFTFNARSQDATAIDAASNAVAGTVKLGGKPESAVADEKGMVYVNIEDKNEIAVVDAKKLEVKSRWALGEGKRAVGLAMDRAKRRLFCSCGNEKMVILDADDGKVLATLPIGRGTDYAVFDPGVGLAFSSNGDGTLTVVGEKDGKYHVVDNVKTQQGARTCALDTKTHNIYLATARFKKAAEGQKGRPGMEPNSFVILVVGKGS